MEYKHIEDCWKEIYKAKSIIELKIDELEQLTNKKVTLEDE